MAGEDQGVPERATIPSCQATGVQQAHCLVRCTRAVDWQPPLARDWRGAGPNPWSRPAVRRTAARVLFRVLGPLEVRKDGHLLAVNSPKQRALLALLLIHANQVVSADRLIEELWAEAPPKDARNVLHSLVLRLRHRLRPADGPAAPPEPVLRTQPPGYFLALPPGQRRTDHLSFGRSVRNRNHCCAVRQTR